MATIACAAAVIILYFRGAPNGDENGVGVANGVAAGEEPARAPKPDEDCAANPEPNVDAPPNGEGLVVATGAATPPPSGDG